MDEFPIKKYDPVLIRDKKSDPWGIYCFICIEKMNYGYPFYVFDDCYAEIAPYSLNKDAFGTICDVVELWTRERLISDGFISG